MYTQFRKVTWWLVAYKCVGSRIYEVLCSAVQVTTPPKLNEATHYQLSSVTFDAATIKIIAVDNIIIFIFILWSKTRGRLSPKSTCFLALPGKKEVNSSNLLEVLKCKLNLYLIVLQCNQFVTSHRNMLIHPPPVLLSKQTKELLHMTINFTPCDKIACHVERFYHVEQWEIAPHL